MSHKMELKDDLLFFAKKGQLFKKCFFLHAFMVWLGFFCTLHKIYLHTMNLFITTDSAIENSIWIGIRFLKDAL